jgi:hypothetical protein
MRFFNNHVFRVILFVIFASQISHAQENQEQLEEYLIAVLPGMVEKAPNILPASDGPYTLESDSIDIVWNLFQSGNLIYSIATSIEGIGDEGSKKYRFVKYTVRDKNEHEHQLFTMIRITSLKKELDDHITLYFKTLINPETQTKYAVVLERYFKDYVNLFY